MQLVRYEAACAAIAACKSVDEVKTWADKAAAMQAYGRMAKDKTLEVSAAEIRIRAERRLGEMLAATKASGGLSRGAADMGGNQHTGKLVRSSPRTAPKLANVGISKNLSSRAQKLAAVPPAEFEAEVGEWRDRVQAEGARVSARLEKAGQREMDKQQADPEPWDDEGAPSIEELMATEKAAADDLAAMTQIVEADDKLAEARSIIKRQQAVIDQLQWRVNGLINENAELIRMVKSLRRRAEKNAA